MKQEILTLLTEQIQKELYSSYLYLALANYYTDEGLDGFANWFYVQAQEEMDHAMLFRTYLLNNDQKVKLLAIDAPDENFENHSKPLCKSLEHEKYVTASIDNIYGVALKEKDYRTIEFLNWFIKEQGEEEKNANDLIKKYELFGHDAKGLYELDQELAGRVYAAPDLILE